MNISRNILTLLAVLVTGLASGQTVRWSPDSGPLGQGQVNRLELRFDNCAPKGEPTLPKVDGLEFGSPSTSQNISWVNGVVSKTVSRVYPARALRQGLIVIPAFMVATDHGSLEVPEAKFNGAQPQVAGAGGNSSLSDVAVSQFTPGKTEVWEGEVFPFTYTLAVSPRFEAKLGGPPEWNPGKVVCDEWGEPRQVQAQVGGASWDAVTYQSRGCALAGGGLTLPPVTQKVGLGERGGRDIFSEMFGNRRMEMHTVESAPPELKVKPLPAAPAGFSKAIGTFQLESKVVPEQVTVGEPITWTLTLSGTGNWPVGLALPPREVSKDFQTIQPKSQRVLDEGTQFSGKLTEDVVLVPTRPGEYTLGPVNYVYFDTAKGEYVTLSTPAVKVTVAPGAAPAVVQQPAAPAPPPTAQTPPTAPPTAPTAPALGQTVTVVLPRDPIGGKGWGYAPWGAGWQAGLGVPVLALLAGWFLLARRHSFKTDPLLPRRRAADAAVAAAGRLDTKLPEAERVALVHDWQQSVRELLALDVAVPGEREVRAAVKTAAGEGSVETWAKVWRESERLLYAQQAEVPETWARDASAAVRGVPLKPVRWWHALFLRNLWPALLVAVLLTMAQTPGRAATFEEAYGKGDFAGAQAAVEQGLSPTDWVGRYNLGLALAQQGKWDRAAGEWVAAFVQHPSRDDVRWNAAIGAMRAGFQTPELGRLVLGNDSTTRAVRWLSPAGWQAVLLGSAVLVCLGLFGWIAREYSDAEGWVGRVFIAAALGLGTLAGLTAWKAIGIYGPLAQPDLAIVPGKVVMRSVPTEADVKQQTRDLAPGTLARVDKTFLGWVRLTLLTGETGWVRKDEATGLYRSWGG